MLRELTTLSEDMVSLRHHIAKIEAPCRPATRDAPGATATRRRGSRLPIPARPHRDRRTRLGLMLAAALSGRSFLFLRLAAPMLGRRP